MRERTWPFVVGGVVLVLLAFGVAFQSTQTKTCQVGPTSGTCTTSQGFALTSWVRDGWQGMVDQPLWFAFAGAVVVLVIALPLCFKRD